MIEINNILRQITPRQWWVIMIAINGLIICLFYYMIWQPWQQREDDWKNIIIQEQKNIEWMKQQAHYILRQKKIIKHKKSSDISAVVRSSSSSYGISIIRLQQQGEQLLVNLKESDFNSMIHWFIHLESQNHIHIVDFDVSAKSDKPGWVTVNRLVLMQKN